MMKKFCVIGLGNPDKYTLTRHNYGKDFVFWLSKKSSLPFVVEKENKHFILNVASSSEVLFLVAESFMNSTGNCIEKAINFVDNFEEIIIVHDDLEVSFGEAKLRTAVNRGIRGHNGIRSIINELYSCRKFASEKNKKALPYFLSLGIGRPGNDLKISISDYVLSKFNIQEKSKLTLIYEEAYMLINRFLKKT
jgi:aminoacyl-tRNA hydrolase